MVLLWASIAAALWAVREVLLPFGVAILLAYVLHPAVSAIHARPLGRFRTPRWVATLGLYGVMGLVLFGIGSVFVPQISLEVAAAGKSGRQTIHEAESLISEVPNQVTRVLRAAGIPVILTWSPEEEDEDTAGTPPAPDSTPTPREDVWAEIDVRQELHKAGKDIQAMVVGAVGTLARSAQGVLGAALGFIFKFFLVLMLTAFMLADVERIRNFFVSLVPAERRDSFDGLLDKIDRGLSGVVRGQLTICMVNGVLTLVGLLILKVKFAFLLATAAAAFSLIPIFGSIVSSVPIVAVALTDGVQKALLGLAWIIGIHALEANLLNPKIMGSAAKIHPVVVVLALVAGEHFYGFTGALFAVPIASVALTIFKFLLARALRVQAEMLAPDPTETVVGPAQIPTPSSIKVP